MREAMHGAGDDSKATPPASSTEWPEERFRLLYVAVLVYTFFLILLLWIFPRTFG